MGDRDSLSSVNERLWSLALSLLGLVIVANVVWGLLQPLLPFLAALLATGLGIAAWNWRRWR
jgi:hypothetical protein